MNAELTAENKPAYTGEKLAFTVGLRVQRTCGTHEDKGCVQVLIILLRVLSVKHVGLFAIYGEKVGAWIVHSQWFEELLQGGMETICGFQSLLRRSSRGTDAPFWIELDDHRLPPLHSVWREWFLCLR